MSGTDNIEKFDVVILGSGLGGLVCGTILTKEGFKVCIVEKNEQIGGSLQTFRRGGVKFDTGVHYLGGLDKGQNLNMLFTYLGLMKRLKLQKMDEEGFDVILFNDDPAWYPYGMGYDNFIRILTGKFPEEADAILAYCNQLRKICHSFPLYNISNSDEYGDQEIFTRGARDYIASLTTNERLRGVLAGNNLLYAGIGDKTPLYVHALVVNSYIESSWRCTDGGDQIAKLLAREIKHSGGIIRRGKRVQRIHITNGVVEHVELKSGEKVYGNHFISNLHPAQTLDMIDENKIRLAYRQRIKGLKNSIASFILYAVLKPQRIKYTNRNYYCFDTSDVWKGVDYTEETWPYAYAMFECVPKHQHEYTEAISIICYMRFDEVKQWENTHNTSIEESERGKDYEEFKRKKAEKLLSVMEKKFPGITDSIQSYYTATPLSYRDYIGTDDGNLYGVVKDLNDPMMTRVSPKTKIPNLLFTGQNINLHGVLGVTVSAVLTCSMLVGKEYLINKIVKANETGV